MEDTCETEKKAYCLRREEDLKEKRHELFTRDLSCDQGGLQSKYSLNNNRHIR